MKRHRPTDEGLDGGGGLVELLIRDQGLAVNKWECYRPLYSVEHGGFDGRTGCDTVDSHPGGRIGDANMAIDDRDVSIEGRFGNRSQFPLLEVAVDGGPVDRDLDRKIEVC